MPIATRTWLRLWAALAVCGALAGCGGGGGGSTPAPASSVPVSTSGWVAGSFLPAASFAGKCVNPRGGNDPNGQPYNEVVGSPTDENNWLRSWNNDLYLWYSEVTDRDPGLFATDAYFKALKTTAITPSGRDKDRFHFTYPTTQWIQLSQSGVEAGYGVAWAVVASLPPRKIVVAYTEPNSPATTSVTPALQRGEEVQAVDGTDVVSSGTQAEVDRFVAGLYPDNTAELHSFTLRNPRTGVVRTVQLQSAAIAKLSVRPSVLTTANGQVGYVLFNDHIAPAESQLLAAFNTMQSAHVTDLVLDLRYNGGGLLAIASQVAYMIAGSVATAGQTFEKYTFNDKHASINPVTGSPITPVPFYNTTLGFSAAAGTSLPALDLRRVYILTGASTCSASESIINSLRGINIEVVQIGSTTCGKPYGFYPADHCGTTYFSVQFKGVNAQGFGDYTDGFSPNNTPVVGGTRGTGCSVADDFTSDLGDPNEGRLAAALQYRSTLACPVASGNKPGPLSVFPRAETDAVVPKSDWLTNRWLDAR